MGLPPETVGTQAPFIFCNQPPVYSGFCKSSILDLCFSGRTLRELSEMLGVRMGTVESRLYRSLRQLEKTVG